jgi:hypothetical protein
MIKKTYTAEELAKRYDKLGGSELATRALALAEKMKPLLAGRGPDVQSAALTELVSIWLAGNHPQLRKAVWEEWTKTVLDLVPLQEQEMFSTRPRPEGWHE